MQKITYYRKTKASSYPYEICKPSLHLARAALGGADEEGGGMVTSVGGADEGKAGDFPTRGGGESGWRGDLGRSAKGARPELTGSDRVGGERVEEQ